MSANTDGNVSVVSADPYGLASTMSLADVLVQAEWFSADRSRINSEQDYQRELAKVAVKLMWGRELGLGPIASCQGIDVIQGRPSPSAGLIASRLDAHPRYAYAELVRTPDVCRLAFFTGPDLAYQSPFVDGRKAATPPDEGLRQGVQLRGIEEYTLADAAQAGLAGKGPWRTYPRAMCYSRAVSEGQRAYAPDLWGGSKLYTPEELQPDAQHGEPEAHTQAWDALEREMGPTELEKEIAERDPDPPRAAIGSEEMPF